MIPFMDYYHYIQFMDNNGRFRRCFVCQYEWAKKRGPEPRRCPNLQCRSQRWQNGVDHRANNAPPPKPKSAVDDYDF